MQSETNPEAMMFLTPEDVADQLKVSIFTVRRWIHQGDLPAYRIGRGWRIAAGDLRTWLATHRQAADPQPGTPS